MLIRTTEENEKLPRSSPGGVNCAYCGMALYFPRIQAPDVNSNVYHPVCASKLAHNLLSEVEALLLMSTQAEG